MQAYVGTYAKYNSSNLDGGWLQLQDYVDKEEFLAACREMHKDEEDPELMFQCWEGIPDSMISEHSIEEECWDLLGALEKYDEDAVRAYIYCFSEWSKSGFEDTYQGYYKSWEEFAEQLANDAGYIDDMPKYLRPYFDYEKYANDLRCSGDFVEHDGHFFSSN